MDLVREITLNLLRSVFCQTASLHHQLLFNHWQLVNPLCNEIITVYLKHAVMCIFTKPYAKLHFLGLEIQYIPPGDSLSNSSSHCCCCMLAWRTQKGEELDFSQRNQEVDGEVTLRLEHEEFWLDIGEKIITPRRVKPRSRLIKDFVEFLFLEGFKLHLDIALSNQAVWVWAGVELGNFCSCLPN